ncbi:hypothetical protein [Nonomuraea sp. bgisy101]|uniref:hypothetical protein n=1 Tax=Nonomuraea sp. bgisy101 TaxID=3413784 RepID=UPI003D70FCF7
MDSWNDIDDQDPDASGQASIEMERSGFRISLSWNPLTGELTVEDPTENWDWGLDRLLPPLCPLDEALTVQLPVHASQSLQCRTAHQAFASAGLLDATLLILPEAHSSLHVSLIDLVLAEQVWNIIDAYRGSNDAAEALASLGKEFNWRISSALRSWPFIVPAAIPAVAAQGIAEWCWRRESDVEDWHHKVDDLTMARANMAATRAVLPHVHPEGVDWPAVRLTLTSTQRCLADGRPLRSLFGEGWPEIITSIHREIDVWQRAEDALGPSAILRLLTWHGSRTESIGDWWGSGWYETAVRRAVSNAAARDVLPAALSQTFRKPEDLADMIAHGPDLLDDELLRWTIHAVQDERRYHWQEGTMAPPAITLPDRVAEELSEILHDANTETSS